MTQKGFILNPKVLTIRIPYNVWIALRRLQENGSIKSINAEVNKHFKRLADEYEASK